MNYDIPHVGIACEYGCYVRCLSWTGRPQNYRPEGSWSSWNVSCWIEKAWDCRSSGTSLLWHCEGEMCRCKGHCRCCLQKWNKFADCGQKYCKDKSVYTLILLWNYLNISHNSLSLSQITVSFDETTTLEDVDKLFAIFAGSKPVSTRNRESP